MYDHCITGYDQWGMITQRRYRTICIKDPIDVKYQLQMTEYFCIPWRICLSTYMYPDVYEEVHTCTLTYTRQYMYVPPRIRLGTYMYHDVYEGVHACTHGRVHMCTYSEYIWWGRPILPQPWTYTHPWIHTHTYSHETNHIHPVMSTHYHPAISGINTYYPQGLSSIILWLLYPQIIQSLMYL